MHLTNSIRRSSAYDVRTYRPGGYTFFSGIFISFIRMDYHNNIHMQYNIIQFIVIQCNLIQYTTIEINTIQYNANQYYTIQVNTIQYNTI